MQMHSLSFDISHTLAGGLVLISFMMLYQDRLYSLLNVFAFHALVLSLSVAWQAYIQDAPHLYVTAAIALVFKATPDRATSWKSSGLAGRKALPTMRSAKNATSGWLRRSTMAFSTSSGGGLSKTTLTGFCHRSFSLISARRLVGSKR